MKKTTIISLLLAIVYVQQVTACDCIYEGNFLKVAPKANLIALVKITKYTSFKNIYGKSMPMSMEAEIIDIYKGGESRKIIAVWGDNGVLCRPYLSQFQPGKYYVIAFYNAADGIKNQTHHDEKITDYAISNCGEYWLQVDTTRKFIISHVNGKHKKIQLGNLKSKLTSLKVTHKQPT